MPNQTHFGFKTVNIESKSNLVKEVFSSVSSKYDFMNNIMSFGLHHFWKDELVKLMPNKNGSLLDVAGGTGDIAYRYFNKAKDNGFSPNIVICDINLDMLNMGQEKLINKNILSGIDFVNGDAQSLPFNDMSFDYYTIAFGIRNVTNIELALKEAYRVLKPGGKFICLEFSKVSNPCFRKFYDLYSFNIIPNLGKIFAGNKDAYNYLVESIRQFPEQIEFSHLISSCGFQQVDYRNLTNGITALHYGFRI